MQAGGQACKRALNCTCRALLVLPVLQQFGLRAVLSVATHHKINLLPAQADGPDEVLKEEEQCHDSHLQTHKVDALLIQGWSSAC